MFLVSFYGLTVAASEDQVIDPNIPDSWYRAPRTASELGIKKFSQAPMLEDRVENGELPAVSERLPEDPPIIEPYAEIGRYGGEATLWTETLNITSYSETRFWLYFGGGRITPDGKVIPSFLKGWDYSEEAKVLTLHLREGLKWSDGHTMTADDYIFWW